MFTNIHAAVDRAVQNAPVLTYGGTGSAVVFYGLHISEIGVIISALASVCGVGLQFYLAFRSMKLRDQQTAVLKAEAKKTTSTLKQEINASDKAG